MDYSELQHNSSKKKKAADAYKTNVSIESSSKFFICCRMSTALALLKSEPRGGLRVRILDPDHSFPVPVCIGHAAKILVYTFRRCRRKPRLCFLERQVECQGRAVCVAGLSRRVLGTATPQVCSLLFACVAVPFTAGHINDHDDQTNGLDEGVCRETFLYPAIHRL